MACASKRSVYIGTADGLYVSDLNGGLSEPRPLGLHGAGGMRCPVIVDIHNEQRLYAGTGQAGAFRSDDGGANWREINQGIISKEIWWIEQHPQTGELYAGTGPASIFKSSDGGETWEDCPQLRSLPETIDWTFPPPPHIAHVKGLALTPSDPRRIFGAVEEGWIIRSKDGGTTWEDIKAGTEFDSHSVIVMPDDPDVVISTSGTGIYKSVDGGDTFSDAKSGMSEHYMTQIALHPSRPKVLLTAAAAVPPPGWRRPEGAAAGFYRSEDQGETWQRLSGGLPERIAAAPRFVAGDPEDPRRFFIGMNDGSIWQTDDCGDTFELAVTGLPPVASLRVAHG
jgi:photosystem II stability/assembly factor-like uncharacterized protein